MRTHILATTLVVIVLLSGCGGGGGGTSGGSTSASDASTLASPSTSSATTPTAVITVPKTVTGGQAGYSASVPTQSGCTYAWTVTNASILVGDGTDSIAFTPGTSGSVTVTCTVTRASGEASTSSVVITISPASTPAYNIDQCLTDQAQSTTLAFAGFGMMTGNLCAQSFFPPGKVADYWGFQYLRDNDPSNNGHNTSFLTRVSCNMLYILNDQQIALMKTLAASQVASVRLYAWKRYTLMKAFRRLMDGTGPTGNSGLSLTAVKAASRELYLLDGQISYERAVVYANIFRTLTAAQKAYIAAMAGQGFSAWPDKSETDVLAVTQGLSNDEVVAMMSYAGDMYSWYTGSLVSDVYFCPERHGTYFGSFYIKDAPAIGHPGYSIDEALTATVGSALVDSTKGYISADGATTMNALVDTQRQNLYANATANMVLARTQVSQALRSLITSTEPSAAFLSSVRAIVDQYSAMYGELDGENNYNYATTFYTLWNNIGGTYFTTAQKASLATLRQQYMTVTYTGGSTVDYSLATTYFLYAADVSSTSADFLQYTGDTATDALFNP